MNPLSLRLSADAETRKMAILVLNIFDLRKKSNIKQEKFEGLCKVVCLSGDIPIPHSMKVCWNKTQTIIRSSLQRKSALQKHYDLNFRVIAIRELELSEQEWLILLNQNVVSTTFSFNSKKKKTEQNRTESRNQSTAFDKTFFVFLFCFCFICYCPF
jgi:hypothetical protein